MKKIQIAKDIRYTLVYPQYSLSTFQALEQKLIYVSWKVHVQLVWQINQTLIKTERSYGIIEKRVSCILNTDLLAIATFWTLIDYNVYLLAQQNSIIFLM